MTLHDDLLRHAMHASAPKRKKPENVICGRVGGFFETVDGRFVGPLEENKRCQCHPFSYRRRLHEAYGFVRELTAEEAATIKQPTAEQRAHDLLLVTANELARIVFLLKFKGVDGDVLEVIGKEIAAFLEKESPDFRKLIGEFISKFSQ